MLNPAGHFDGRIGRQELHPEGSRMLGLRSLWSVATATLLAGVPVTTAAAASEAQSLDELRNTVINLLDALVQQGVMTREAAARLVQSAQQKAAADAAATAQADAGAIRVPYVPQTVRDEISRQVAADIRPQLVEDVVQTARTERWGVPAALPDWLGRVRWSGDVRVRGQSDLFASNNEPNTQLDFLRINERGGIDRAGVEAFANTTEDRHRLRVQARLAIEASLGSGVTAGARIVTGTIRDPVSLNQTLGQYGARFATAFDLAYVRWESQPFDELALRLQGGRFENPWQSTDLVYDRDLTFDGVAVTGRVPFGNGNDDARSNAFLTLGAHPLQEVELSAKDKWLLGAQIGTELRFDSQRIRVAAAYYDFRNVRGRRNAFESTLFDYTAPSYLQRGNTLFDIRNDLAPDTNLFALAGDYELIDALVAWDTDIGRGLRLGLNANYVQNIGWSSSDVQRNSGIQADARTDGYRVEVNVGHADVLDFGRWRAYFAYRYVQRDAVLDAFTDSDFRLGGTDTQGYLAGFDVGLAQRTWMRLRYYTADEIDGPLFAVGESQFPIRFPFGVDVVQLDLTSQF
jgi:polyhydroxyalkanoate synthesis regulator phasin